MNHYSKWAEEVEAAAEETETQTTHGDENELDYRTAAPDDANASQADVSS